VNTSFNIRGEPIVCTPRDALRCFQATEMDVLVLEDCVINKRDLGASTDDSATERYRASVQPD
jgi:carbamoyltransferase